MDTDPDREWAPTQHGRDQRGLQRRVSKGLFWTLIDTWGSQFLGLIIFAILARLLQPIDFGLVALAAVFVALGELFVDQGLGDAIVQKSTLTTRQLDTAFWASVLTGSLLAVAGVLLGPVIADLLNEERLGPIIQVLSLVFILVALTSIQMGLLRRELDFRGLAIRRLLSLAAGGAVGVAMALTGFGAWALVGQQLVAAVVALIALWAVTPWRPGFHAAMEDFRPLFSFGIKVVGGDLLTFLSRNTDRLLIGVFLTPVALGFYAVAFRLLDTSQVLLLAAARRLVFPTFSRLQHDAERVKRAYLRVERASAAITIPGYIGMALIATEAINVVFGEQWAESAATAAILFMIGPVLSIQAFSSAVWNAMGHPGVSLRFKLLSTATNIVGFVIAVYFFGTIVAVATAFALRSYLLLPLNLYWMRRYTGVPVSAQLRQVVGIVLASAVMAGTVIGTRWLLSGRVTQLFLLLAEIAVGVASYVVALAIFDRPLLRELIGVAIQILPGRRPSERPSSRPTESERPPSRRTESEERLVAEEGAELSATDGQLL